MIEKTQIEGVIDLGGSHRSEIGLLFLANFVHQVVNPLNGVIGTLDNISAGLYEPSVESQKLNASRAQLEQCVTLIRNLAYLSDFFFQSPGREALKPARAQGLSILPQVVIEAAQFFQSAGEKKKIRIELEDPKNQYRVKVRPELLRQIFMNIFDNWLKYGAAEQVVRIKVSVNKGKELVILISGVSISFDTSESMKIFDLGFRGKNAVGKVAQGSGIGLYICKQIIINAVGGTISASHDGGTMRTTFRLAIPEGKWEL